MIVGLGMDMASLSRIGKCLERFGAQFCRRILTEAERELLPEAPAARTAFVAGRFAAKEAAVKALGTGFAEGIAPQDVEVLRLPSGRPELHFYGAAARRAELLGVKSAHLSLTHEREIAGAVVVLEGEGAGLSRED